MRWTNVKAITVLMTLVLSMPMALWAGDYDDDDDDDDDRPIAELQQRVTDLEAVVLAPPRILRVTCDAGATITQALEAARPRDTILVTGTCRETIMIMQDKITLQGENGALIDGEGSDQAVVTVDGAQGVAIQSLTVRNGNDGLLVRRGAAVIVEGVVAEDNADDGIQIDENSTARLTDCTALRNGDDGIFVGRTSSATFLQGHIISNDNSGALNGLSSSGINIAINSSVLINAGVQVTTTNNERGINIAHSSSGFLLPGATVTANNNSLDGLTISNSSSLFMHGSATSVTANTNGERGIELAGASFRVREGTVTANGNGNDGIGAFGSSRLSFGRGATMVIENSGNFGVIGARAASILVDAAALVTVRGSAGVGIGLFDNTSMLIFGQVISEQNGTDGMSLSRNATVRVSGPSAQFQSIQNSGRGVVIARNSLGDFASGTTINGNTSDGIVLVQNATLRATNMAVQNNGGDGLEVDDGISVNVSNATITGSGGTDIRAAFGARLTLNANTVGTIVCDATVLSRGTDICP